MKKRAKLEKLKDTSRSRLCDCGRVAVKVSRNDFVCQRCADIEAKGLHNPPIMTGFKEQI